MYDVCSVDEFLVNELQGGVAGHTKDVLANLILEIGGWAKLSGRGTMVAPEWLVYRNCNFLGIGILTT